MQALRSEIEEMVAQEAELRGLIVEAANKGAAETAKQLQGQPPAAEHLSAVHLQRDLEIVQGARQFAQSLVVVLQFKSIANLLKIDRTVDLYLRICFSKSRGK